MSDGNYCAGCDLPVNVAASAGWDNDTDLCWNCLDARVAILEAKNRRLTEALQVSTKALRHVANNHAEHGIRDFYLAALIAANEALCTILRVG